MKGKVLLVLKQKEVEGKEIKSMAKVWLIWLICLILLLGGRTHAQVSFFEQTRNYWGVALSLPRGGYDGYDYQRKYTALGLTASLIGPRLFENIPSTDVFVDFSLNPINLVAGAQVRFPLVKIDLNQDTENLSALETRSELSLQYDNYVLGLAAHVVWSPGMLASGMPTFDVGLMLSSKLLSFRGDIDFSQLNELDGSSNKFNINSFASVFLGFDSVGVSFRSVSESLAFYLDILGNNQNSGNAAWILGRVSLLVPF